MTFVPDGVNVGNTGGPDLRRTIGFWSGTALLVGSMIGGGIFRTPASIATVMHDPTMIMGLWVFFGIVTMCGALALAELACMLPQTGGTYVYLRTAYGDSAAFVFGWLYLLAAIPAGMAAVAVFSGELILRLAGAGPSAGTWGIPLLAIGGIVMLTSANIAGVRWGAAIQNVLAVIKVAALVAIIACAFFSGAGDFGRWISAPGNAQGSSDFAAAAKSVMFTYNGWVYVSLVAGELKNAERLLTRIILAGTGTAVVLYLLANLAYLYALPLAEMPGKVVAAEVMIRVVGPVGGTVIVGCILASVIGALNGVILTKSRVAYALGRDGLSFAFLGKAHPTRATPYVSLLIQGGVAVALVLALREPLHPLRLFDRLTAYFVVVEWLALLFAIAAIFVLRRTMPDAARPYRTPAYPLVPLIFVLGTAAGLVAVVWSACSKGDFSPLVGLAIVAAGFPMYWIWRRTRI